MSILHHIPQFLRMIWHPTRCFFLHFYSFGCYDCVVDWALDFSLNKLIATTTITITKLINQEKIIFIGKKRETIETQWLMTMMMVCLCVCLLDCIDLLIAHTHTHRSIDCQWSTSFFYIYVGHHYCVFLFLNLFLSIRYWSVESWLY